MTTKAPKPMLAESINLDQLPPYIADPLDDEALARKAWRGLTSRDLDDIKSFPPVIASMWWMQHKADGHRFMVEVTDGEIQVWNRAGQPKTSMLSHAVLGQFEAFDKGHWVFDGELVGKRLLLFDLPVAASLVDPSDGFEFRYNALQMLMTQVWQPDGIELLECARTGPEKLAMVKLAIDQQREGVILRSTGGMYQAGRRPTLLKCKFTKECDAIVTETGVDGHNNVVLSVLDPDHDRVVEIGRASANGKRPVPQRGDVWEVRFLYVVDRTNPRLYQPRLMRKRVDKGFEECLLAQLDHCFTDKELNLTKSREEM